MPPGATIARRAKSRNQPLWALALALTLTLLAGCLATGPPPCKDFEPVVLETLIAEPDSYHLACVSTQGYVGEHRGTLVNGAAYFTHRFHSAPLTDAPNITVGFKTGILFEENLTKLVEVGGRFRMYEYLHSDEVDKHLVAQWVRDP
jgi:hypothetical protein